MRVTSFMFGVFFCILIIGCKKEKSRICDLYEGSVGYAIGTIDEFVTTPFKVSYVYSFEVNGRIYSGNEKAYGIGQKDASLIGRSFVVVYALGEPSNSDLNFDFLIESDADFDEFLSLYLDSPPPPDFPNRCK